MTKYSIACMYICYNMWLLDYLFRTFEEIIGLILALNRLPYVHNQNIERKTDNLSVFLVIQNLKLICSPDFRIFAKNTDMPIFKNSDELKNRLRDLGFCRRKSVILNTKKRIHKKPILTMRWKLFPKSVWSSDLGFYENHHHVWEIQLALPKEKVIF